MLRRPYSEDDPGECLVHELPRADGGRTDWRPPGSGPACQYLHPDICPDHEVQCEVCLHVILKHDAVVERDHKSGRLIAVCVDKAECAEVVAARLRFGRLLLATAGYLERGVS